MPKPSIVVENVSKVYRIGYRERRADTLVGSVAGALAAPVRNFRNLYRLGTAGRDGDDSNTLRAIDDVSFEVPQGEVLGVIGRNGAGKSTLLKILSRVTRPTSGCIRMRGRVSALLEVGTGFHPELTGRENVYLNGTILGMTKREIDRKFDEIVDFSGVEKFLDTPVKRYSSGMKVRLAFAVAAHLEPEILLVDEVLAVGDVEFQNKCMGRMDAIAHQGRTVLLVSHNMTAIKSLCSKCYFINDGKIAAQGSPNDVIRSYLETSTKDVLADWDEPVSHGPVAINSLSIRQGGLVCGGIVDDSSPYEIVMRYSVKREVTDLLVGFDLMSSDGAHLFRSYDLESHGLTPRESGEYESSYTIKNGVLARGVYYIKILIGIHRQGWLSRDDVSIRLQVTGSRQSDVDFPGMIQSPGKWAILRTDQISQSNNT